MESKSILSPLQFSLQNKELHLKVNNLYVMLGLVGIGAIGTLLIARSAKRALTV